MKMKNYLLILAVLSVLAFPSCDEGGADFTPSTSGTGTGGSLASFTILSNYLYSVLDNELKTYRLDDNGQLTLVNRLPFFTVLETIGSYNNRLLIGSQTGVFFLDLSNPSNPIVISQYDHFTACDPVVARDGIAYSTLRSSDCRTNRNDLLDVIDISDITNPVLIRSYTSDTPYGLAVVPGFLFVCEKGGISIIDNGDPANLEYLNLFIIDNATPKDIIPSSGHLVVTTDIGIYNVRYTDLGEMRVIGQLTGN